MATGYLGPNIWDNSTKIVTQISSESSNTYASDTSTAPKDATKVIKMATDQYPTGVSFAGCPMGNHTETTRDVKLSISNKEGTIYHELATVGVDHGNWAEHQTGGNNGETIIVRELHRGTEPISSWNKTNQGTAWMDLTGAYLAIMKEGPKEIGLYWYDTQVTVNIATEYIAKNVTFTHNGGGTITVNDAVTSSLTMVRGSTIRFTVTPSRGYAIKTITKTGGTWSTVSLSGGTHVMDFTMSSPAQDITINVEFKQTIFNITKNVSLTEVGTISGPDSAIAGESVTVTRPTTSTEYRFDGWTIKTGDAYISFTTNGSNATFTMPTGNVIVTARYTKHTITWSGAYLAAQHEDGWDHVTLTYRGVATDNFASLGHTITYWIYKNGVEYVQLENAPNAGNQTVNIPVVSGEENNEVRYSLVAKCPPLTVGAATASLHVGSVNRTVKYCKKSGKNLQWVECVSYFCVGPKIESSISGTKYSQYIRVSYPGIYETTFKARPNKVYTFTNTSDEEATVVFEDEHDAQTQQYESNTVTIQSGATVTTTIADTRVTATFNVSGEGSVSLECEEFSLLESNQKFNKGVWVEVEPFYFHGSDGWQLCSFV